MLVGQARNVTAIIRLHDAASNLELGASARRKSRRMLNELQDLGYFREVSHV